ncbi:MAG: hypothetical protein ABI859_17420 [Pseudomonadota bacterium]
MSLVPLVSPDTEAEVLTTVALLDAYGIPSFVRGGGFGSLYPGPQVAGYNAKTIMVQAESLRDAQDLLQIPSDVDEPPV